MDKWKVRRTKKGELDGGMPYQMVNFGYLRDLTPPEDSLKIWRFMDLPKFLSILQSKTLYFARADQFDDPFEGARGNTGDEKLYIKALAEALREEMSFDGDNKGVEKSLDDARKIIDTWKTIGFDTNHMYQNFISCWHQNEMESDAMWRLYTKDLTQGVAIQSTCGRLRDSFIREFLRGPITIAPVEYIDYTLPLGLSDNPSWFKKKAFEHEKEIRAIIMFDYPSEEKAPKGWPLPIDPDVLIENLYVSPTAQPWFVELAIDVIGKYGYKFNVVQSQLLDKGFR